MLELLAFVILVAIFFGISLSAALHGVIVFIIWAIVLFWGIMLLLPPIYDFLEPKVKTQINKPKQAPAKARKPKEINYKRSAFRGGFIVFVFTYLLTAVILMIIYEIYFSITKTHVPIPSWLAFLLPFMPFTMIEIYRYMKNHANRKD